MGNKKTKQPEISEAALPKVKRTPKRAVKDILFPVAGVVDSVETNYSNNSRIKKALIAMIKLRVRIIVYVALAVCLAACYFAYKSSNTATAEMSLNYEEAANGLNPNATRFNAYNISSTDVAENALKYCGIVFDNTDVENLSNAITISSTNNKSFSEGDYYISTTFRIKLNKPASIKGVKSKELLNFLCKAYKDDFYSKYTENRSILSFNIDIFNDKEYLEIADLLDIKAQQIEKYLNTRAKQSKSFIESESNETFKSLVQKAEDIRDYDIAKYRAFVIASGCSYDKARYIASLSYINKLKNISYNKDMAAYNVHNDGIRVYDDNMISVVMIPSIDEDKKSYYMSKTKTGMDYIANRADDYLASAQVTSKEITVNQDIMSKMSAGKNSKATINKANQMINDIRDKFSELSSRIENIDKTYIKYRTKDYLTFKAVNNSLFQTLHIDVLFELAAGLLLLFYFLIWLKFRKFKGDIEK
ncbi:MAG: hypothetical protein K6B52_01630 [Clostridiales bacterium]|nr:hypothetical protein [Clostridiales bacterium]